MIESPRSLEVPIGDHHRVGAELADLLRYRPPQLQVGFEEPIGKVEDLEVVDSDDGAGFALFAFAQGCHLVGMHIADAGLAAGQQQVGDLLALSGPLRHRCGGAVFHVIGMGDDAQEAGDVVVIEEREFSHSPQAIRRGANRPEFSAVGLCWVR